jgi:hypothetical protein
MASEEMDEHNNPTRAPRFDPGARVRVRYAVTVPDFEDIPLGGWTGTITTVEQAEDQIGYEIEWDEKTLDAMHPVFRKRCERDGLETQTMWLSEEDIEPDDGTPVPIEQPTAIKTLPLSEKDEDDRIRTVFGLTHDDPLPEVNSKTLVTYYRYLITHLTFPFSGTYERETGPFSSRRAIVTITGLSDAKRYGADEGYGLICEGRDQTGKIQVPLADVELKMKDPNSRIVSDYSSWFVNFR